MIMPGIGVAFVHYYNGELGYKRQWTKWAFLRGLSSYFDILCYWCNISVIFDNVRSIIVAIWESIAARASVSKAGNVCDYDAETAKGLRDG